jgi:hypothetical protein
MLRFCLLQHLRESCQAVIIETHHLIHPPRSPPVRPAQPSQSTLVHRFKQPRRRSQDADTSRTESPPGLSRRQPVLALRQRDDLLSSWKDSSTTRQTAAIPASTEILFRARSEVQHPDENFAEILARSGYIAVTDAAWD